MLRSQVEAKSQISVAQSMFFKTPNLTLDKMCIVFDIDDTLQSGVKHRDEYEPESYLQLVKEKFPEQIISYEYKGVTYDQILSPGVLETFQYLLRSGCHVALFSASANNEHRNQQFKTELLKRALSVENFKKHKDQVLVFSEKHMTDCDPSDLVSNILGTRGPYRKKDLNVVISAFAELGLKFSLDQVILVDNDLPWMAKGQIKNFLKIRGCSGTDIDGSKRMQVNIINHMFYVVGLIDRILTSDTPLTTLFNLQFIDDEEKSGYKTYDFNLQHQSQYYEVGLSILRSVNKDLRLIDEAYILQELKNKRICLA